MGGFSKEKVEQALAETKMVKGVSQSIFYPSKTIKQHVKEICEPRDDFEI